MLIMGTVKRMTDAFPATQTNSGPIWLFPEMDLVAYGRSVRRLVSLQPQVNWFSALTMFLLRPPEVLGELATAFEKGTGGEIQYPPAGEG